MCRAVASVVPIDVLEPATFHGARGCNLLEQPLPIMPEPSAARVKENRVVATTSNPILVAFGVLIARPAASRKVLNIHCMPFISHFVWKNSNIAAAAKKDNSNQRLLKVNLPSRLGYQMTPTNRIRAKYKSKTHSLAIQ